MNADIRKTVLRLEREIAAIKKSPHIPDDVKVKLLANAKAEIAAACATPELPLLTPKK